ncbi:MAG: glycosyltransferase family 2 protein [Vulcanisaeta sp.]
MSVNEPISIEVRELTKQLIQQYIMNQYPWGLITRPLTPISQAVLLITYIITIAMLILSLLQIIVLTKYGIKSLGYLREVKSAVDQRNKALTSRLPFVTILIPIKGESTLTIERSLQNIARLSYPKDLLEVIYISDDPEYYVNSIINILNNLSHRLGINVKVIHRTDNSGYKGGALNYGLRYAKGDVIAIFDVDTITPSNYLLSAVNKLMMGYDAVTAVWRGYYTVDNAFSRLMKFMYDVYNEVFIRGRFLSNGFPAISGNNIVIWRKVLNAVNGFCRCTGEDLDLSIKLRAMGYRVGLIDEYVACEVPSTYPSLKRQFSRWLFNGIWNMKHNLRLLLTSGEVTTWEKIDGILWMLQFPSISFAALSMLITLVLSIIGVLIPPAPILFLELLNAIIVLSLFVVLLVLGKHVGYSIPNSVIQMTRSALLMIVMSFPMLVYSLESLVTDEWEWKSTPKGPINPRSTSLRDLVHELSLIPIIIITIVILILNNQIITIPYIISIIAILAYGLRFVIAYAR